MNQFTIDRRHFLRGATATLALTALQANSMHFMSSSQPMSEGTLFASTMKCDFVPVDKNASKIHKDVVYEKEKYREDLTEPTNPKIELNAAPATRLHMLDFLAAIEKGSRPVADIEEGHISTASCILANISMKLGRPVVYNPQKRQIINDAEANLLLKRLHRSPFIHPDPTAI